MKLIDLDHVQLAAPVGCEEQAREFFGRLLGLVEIEKPEMMRARGGCWFRLGSRQLHIGVEENFRPALKAHPAFEVDHVDEVFECLKNAGVRCKWDEPLGAVRRFHASDPWGNRLEFTASRTAT